MQIKVIEGHPYPYGMGEDADKEGQKPDLRNKQPKTGQGGNQKKNNSRKSEASKQNKKRWY